MAARRNTNKASTAQIIEFFSTAPDQAKTVVDFFKTADAEQGKAALAVATALVQQKTVGTEQGSAPRKPRAPKPADAEGPAAQAPTSGSNRVAGNTARQQPEGPGTAQRVVGGGTAAAPSQSER